MHFAGEQHDPAGTEKDEATAAKQPSKKKSQNGGEGGAASHTAPEIPSKAPEIPPETLPETLPETHPEAPKVLETLPEEPETPPKAPETPQEIADRSGEGNLVINEDGMELFIIRLSILSKRDVFVMKLFKQLFL